MPSVSIIVPARNEARTIADIIVGARPHAREIIVVDGHSTDDTAAIARRLGAKVVSDNGKGKGDALRIGAQAASGEILVFMDADGSHNPAALPSLLQPLIQGKADHVSGSRMLGGSQELFSSPSEAIRLFGNVVITLSVNLRFGVKLTDVQNGFRCLWKRVFDELDLRENIMTIEQEMAFETLRRGFRLVEVPAHEYRRRFGGSSMRVSQVAHRFIYCLVRNLLKARLRPLSPELAKTQEEFLPSWGSHKAPRERGTGS